MPIVCYLCILPSRADLVSYSLHRGVYIETVGTVFVNW